MWKFLKDNFFNGLLLIGCAILVWSTMSYQYNISKKENHKNVVLKQIGQSLQIYSLRADVVESLGRQLVELSKDSDDYRFKLK